MYVGSTALVAEHQWALGPGHTLEFRRCEYVPAVVKVFDEILTNALDARARSSQCTHIEVDIHPGENRIVVANNGPGISVDKHEKEGVWIPELVMGNLFAGSNFDDSVVAYVGGRHGFGAKLANIFSDSFRLRTVDPSKGTYYEQVWQGNMATCHPPVVRPAVGRERAGFTIVDFALDMSHFGLGRLGGDTLAILRRRVVDVAALAGPKCTVVLDGDRVPVHSFSDYAARFASALGSPRVAADRLKVNGQLWEVAVGAVDGQKGPAAHVAFVNGVHTVRGGTHLNRVLAQISSEVAEVLSGRLKESVLPSQVRPHLFVALSAALANPSFDGQAKDKLTTPVPDLGKLPSGLVRAVADLPGVEAAVRHA